GNGQGNNGCGLGNGGPNGTNENCGGNGGGSGGHWEDNYTWDFVADEPESQTNSDIDDGYETTAFNQQLVGQVANVNYLRSNGPVTSDARILSCISPGSKGGAWKPKAYYIGTTPCSTTAFNNAPTLSGRTFDNPPPTNSLPAN
ncbi:MAG TPA: hypothetical protein VM308_07465, partial [Sphingomicrobium sp.]|nr:hypothetical protein [Sphingomicrobium sp.]